jgi:uncharacterized protein (UPF0210 family)
MKIRSITYFLNPGWPTHQEPLSKAADFIAAAKPAFEEASFEVQTIRLATLPFPNLLSEVKPPAALEFTKKLVSKAQEMGYDYISLGPALPEKPESFDVLYEMIAASDIAFLSGMMTTRDGQISLPAVRRCAETIHEVAGLSEDGFANLRFAALANVPPGAPFFPAAYHQGEGPAFALALEAADLALNAFEEAGTIDDWRRSLISNIEGNAGELEELANRLSDEFGVHFGGIDFTLAPFPQRSRSIGTSMEMLGVPAVGSHGSLTAAAILADTLDQAHFRRAGFNGLMLPVLEDVVLAERAVEGVLSVQDLLLYSSVCGTGLDTVPLAGDTSIEQIYAILLDLAALSMRLDKPLTARLMPIPGKKVGDPTGFDFDYFSNSLVMPIKASPLKGLLAGAGNFTIKSR